MENTADLNSRGRDSADAMQHLSSSVTGMTGITQMSCSIREVVVKERKEKTTLSSVIKEKLIWGSLWPKPIIEGA